MTEGRLDEARTWFMRAVSVPQTTRAAHIELANAWGNLAIVSKDRAEQEQLTIRGANQLERELGADHPWTLIAYERRAVLVTHPRRGAELLESVCARVQRLHPHLAYQLGECAFELVWLAEERGDIATVTRWLPAVTSEVDLGIARGYRALIDHAYDEVASLMTTFITTYGKQSEPWIRMRVADAHLVVALAALQQQRVGVAISRLQSALAIMEAPSFLSSTAPFERRLARVRALLAVQLATRDPAKARHLAGQALQWYRPTGGYDEIANELAAITITTGSR